MLAPTSLEKAPGSERWLPSIGEVRQFFRGGESQSRPVAVRGVAVYHDPQGHRSFVCDGQDSIYIHVKPKDAKRYPLEVGMLVEVEGVASQGDFNTCIEGPGRASANIRILGTSALPPAREPTWCQLAEPGCDSQWVSVRAIVRALSLTDGRIKLELRMDGECIHALVASPEATSAQSLPWHLMDCRVAVRGVVSCIYNRDRQMTGRMLLVASMQYIVPEIGRDLVEPPLRPCVSLLTANSREAFAPIRIRGTVTFADAGRGIYLRDDNIGMWVEIAQPLDLENGSVVEVEGRPALAPFRPIFRGVKVTVLHRESAPVPHHLTIPHIFSGTHHADLVSLEATLVKAHVVGDETILNVQASGQTFRARMDRPLDIALSNSLQPGSRVSLCGICLAKPARESRALQVMESFELLLRDSSDITILHSPPIWLSKRLLAGVAAVSSLAAIFLFWGGGIWTSARVGLALWILVASSAAALMWVGFLRRRVDALTARIQRDAIHSERLRIARDLHDDLGARVTHLGSLAALGCEDAVEDRNEGARTQFAAIRDGAREIVQALDAAVWTVNPENDSIAELAIYLCQWAGDFFHPTTIRCRFDVDDNFPKRSLPVALRSEIFFAVKETLNNAARHSGASEVWLRIAATEKALSIITEDDGRGLPASKSGGHGLVNIRKRIERVGGKVSITTQPSGGTAVEFTIPIQ